MSGTQPIKVMALLRRKQGVSREEFLRQWEGTHGPLLVDRLPGIRTYIQNRALELPPHGEPPIDGFDEMWLDDLAAYRRLDAFYRSNAGRAIRDHEDQFLDRGEKLVFAVDQKFIVNQGGAVKVMNYVRTVLPALGGRARTPVCTHAAVVPDVHPRPHRSFAQ
jgi:uncharacterized protein (TIGR02118 family)